MTNDTDVRVGYLISKDRYLKRDELGVIFQLNVVPSARRRLVGAALIRAAFERSAYGCRLYCCWCAQDLEANRFWESLGFVPLAFRAGSTGKRRVHIFWQRRIVAGDVTTPYWYPFQTNAGAIREDRLVFPIPPGTHWREVRAVEVQRSEVRGQRSDGRALPGPRGRTSRSAARKLFVPPPGKVAIFVGGRIKYVDRPGYVAPPEKPAKAPKAKKPPREAPPAVDRKYLAAARELRDRYLEHVNGGQLELESCAKYDVACRQLAETPKKSRLLTNPRAA